MQQNITPLTEWDLNGSEREMDISKVVRKAYSLWPWIILCVLMSGVLAFIYFYFAIPVYKINAKILIKDDDSKTGNGSGDMSMLKNIGLLSGTSNVDNELEIVKSYTLMNKVVQDLQLNVVYEVRKPLKAVEIYGKQVPFKLHFLSFNDSLLNSGTFSCEVSIHKTGITLKEKNHVYDAKWQDTVLLSVGKALLELNHDFKGAYEKLYGVAVFTPAAVTRNYMNMLDAAIPNKQVSTINLSLPASIPEKGVVVVNRLIKEYMQANVDDNNRIADSTMAFIDTRLVVVGDQLQDIEKQIQDFKQRNELADLGEQAKALIINTGDYTKQMADQEVQLNVIESLENYLQDNIDNPRVVPASLIVQDATLSAVISQYNLLLMQRTRLLLSSTESNPVVINIDEQLKVLRGNMLHGIASVKRSAQTALASLRGNAGHLQAEIRRVPAKERVYLDYSRQQAIRQELYLFLLQKREEAAISRSSTVANIRIIDAAQSDPLPFQPQKRLILALAVLGGMILPFLIVYAKDKLNTRLSEKKDIEAITSVPIIGEIGHSDGSEFVVVAARSRASISEQFRALRTSLQFLLTKKNDNVVMVTSSISGEGKSFISTNLATILAIAGKRVVLMELDLRKPKIFTSLGIKPDKGFSQYAVGLATAEEIIQPSGIHRNLYLISSGPIPPNPAELLLQESTSQLLDKLKEDFDYVIIDTTPNLVTDAQLLSAYAHTTLYIVRMNYTRKQQVGLVNALYKAGKMPRLNLVVNDIRQGKYSGGYYGYGYGNEYGYGDYVEDEHIKKRSMKHFFGSKS
ncbi:GumC family protein [Chitinophaga sp. 30R24]|uniref:GumC family protein n=1 Tax=Chitinophaga sp. 30R24 TaxID=3248838 RepID=UPI003B90239F